MPIRNHPRWNVNKNVQYPGNTREQTKLNKTNTELVLERKKENW
jgi:hypothetical protein